MKFEHDGRLYDSSVHDCARFQAPCVFCSLNAELKRNGRSAYAVPFDIPGIYNPNDEPNVVIIEVEPGAEAAE